MRKAAAAVHLVLEKGTDVRRELLVAVVGDGDAMLKGVGCVEIDKGVFCENVAGIVLRR